MTTEAQKRAVRKYENSNYRLNIVFPKGTKERIEKLGLGKSNSAFIRDTVLSGLDRLEKIKNNAHRCIIKTVKENQSHSPARGGQEEKMKEFELKQVARNNSESFGCVKVTAAWLCGTEAQKEDFINSLGENWVRIPAELVDETAEQNFISYARA